MRARPTINMATTYNRRGNGITNGVFRNSNAKKIKKANINVKKLNSFNMVLTWCYKPNHTSITAKIILKLSVCVFLNIGRILKTVILNYSTRAYMASNTDVVKKTIL